jgi:hypothetical protein
MGNLVGEMMVGFFKLMASGLTGMEGRLELSTFGSASSKLGSKITNSGIEMSNLVSEMSVGFFKLMNSSFSIM